MQIPSSRVFDAFSMIVDINKFTPMVSRSDVGRIADFVKDTLIGSIVAIEKCGGSVVGFMGDAIFGILPTADDAASACFAIAKDIDRICGYLAQSPEDDFSLGQLSVKIGVEYGPLNVSKISSKAVGVMPFLIGPATNYAARIMEAGIGNRCHVGPAAVAAGFKNYNISDLQYVEGKAGEGSYEYHELLMGHIWIEGPPKDGCNYW